MININTLRIVEMLNMFAELSEYPILPFKDANSDNFREHVFYDPNITTEFELHPIVCNACLGCCHHDIVSYHNDCWRDVINNVDIGVRFFEGSDEPTIIVRIDNEEIIVENGRWYFG